MQRNDWSVKYTGKKLAEGARAQLAFRKERLQAWEAKKDAIMKEVKEKGLTIHEDVAEDMYKLSNSANALRRGATIMVDRSLQEDLNGCVERIQRNREKVGEYEAWIQMMDAHGEDVFNVEFDDWSYFFGKIVGSLEA
jgi:hypothetical protein